MDNIKSKHVLVVGAGPVGLSAALFLSQKGINVTIIDKLPEPTTYSKALVINPRTLELLDKIGVVEEFIKNSYELEAFNFYRKDYLIARNDFHNVKHKIPILAVQPQAESERILTNLLQNRNIKVQRGVCLTKIKNLDNLVECGLQDSKGVLQTLNFDYVFSADGAHSIIRKSLNLNFNGSSYDEPWYLYDVKLKTNLRPNEGIIRLLDDEFVFILRIKEDIWRIFGNKCNMLSKLPKGTLVESILWESKFIISHRVIEKFGVGNVFFGGDAAHVHSPAGGRGMNLGIEDAYVFTELLENGKLNEYHKTRSKAVQGTVTRVLSLTNLVRGKTLFSKIFRFLSRLIVPVFFPFLKNKLTRFVYGLDHEIFCV